MIICCTFAKLSLCKFVSVSIQINFIYIIYIFFTETQSLTLKKAMAARDLTGRNLQLDHGEWEYFSCLRTNITIYL